MSNNTDPPQVVPPQPRILDVYGAFVRELGGWISISALIALLSHLDTDPQAVRSAASRMKRRGLLQSRKVDGAAGYELTEAAHQILRDGDGRIFRDPATTADDSWALALFSVPESDRQKRYLIRSRLAGLGFAQGPATSWFAPVSVVPETRRTLARMGLDKYVTLWRAEHLGFGDFSNLVAAAWDFDAIRARYEIFMDQATAVLHRWENPGETRGQDAFVDYLNILSTWRSLPYLDPGLPPSVTPPDWPGSAARLLFTRVSQELRPRAMRHFVFTVTS